MNSIHETFTLDLQKNLVGPAVGFGTFLVNYSSEILGYLSLHVKAINVGLFFFFYFRGGQSTYT